MYQDHGLSLPALDNRVDNSGQALYDNAKSLICKHKACAAAFLCTPVRTPGLPPSHTRTPVFR